MLDNAPSDWEPKAFESIARLQPGFAFKSKNFVEHSDIGLPLIRIRDLTSQTPEKYIDEEVPHGFVVNDGDILVGMDGEFNCVVWRAGQAALNQRVLRVFNQRGTSKKWLHHLLQPILSKLEAQISGTTVKHLSTKHLKNLMIATPPIAEQERIAEILTSVDDSIRATEAVIEQAERVKRGLMEDLLTGGLGSAAIARGEVPKDWKRTKIIDLLVLQYGTSLTKANRKSGVVPVYGSAGIVGFHNTPLVEKQSIVIGRKGSVGTVFLTQKPFYAIDTTYFVELKQDVDWVWLKELLVWLNLVKLNEATGVPGLNRDRVYRQLISLPPLAEQKRIAAILTQLDETILANKATVNAAETLKRGLMDDLLTGRVRTV